MKNKYVTFTYYNERTNKFLSGFFNNDFYILTSIRLKIDFVIENMKIKRNVTLLNSNCDFRYIKICEVGCI